MIPTPPIAKIVPKEIALHGDTRIDNYAWMRDRTNPDAVAYLEAENQYTEAVMEPLKPLQEKLYQEILGRIQETDLSVPVKRDDYFYYTRTEEGKQYPIHSRRRDSENAPEELLLDLNALAAGHSFLSLGAFVVVGYGWRNRKQRY